MDLKGFEQCPYYRRLYRESPLLALVNTISTASSITPPRPRVLLAVPDVALLLLLGVGDEGV